MPFLPRAHKHGGTVAYRLCYTVCWVTRERLQAYVVVASVPRVEPRRAVLLPEPQIRHLLDIPLDPERQSFLRALHLVPALREVLEVEHLAHSSLLRQHAQVYAGARLVFDDGPGVSSAVIHPASFGVDRLLVRHYRRPFGKTYPAALLEERTPEGYVVPPHGVQGYLALV